ncbi:enoyl-CoA hydratase/isomerase [Rhodopirellula maiorica SM1]|uniref:Enoyl-CoA hydratase/isomerase n=1 Tax=Rhodopirellula maiorica SM1 TaxID=1265738 RepID=M5RRC3_9BACT|nr:enoyl-CoA hydratase/isomerase [Rhodopirellula maiorica SM1]
MTLNRPDRRNALSIELLEALCHELTRLEQDTTNRVVILAGDGKVFSAGLDLREAADTALVERSANTVKQTLEKLHLTPLIVIAVVQGGAFAGGAGVMAACDVVIAAEDARISFPEARRGLLPALVMNVLRHKVREGDLRDLLLTGDPISAGRAQQIGLVQRVVPATQLHATATTIARSVLAGGPETIRQTKKLIGEAFSDAASGGETDLIDRHLAARHSDEAREGLAAFNEKREPKWP